MYSTYDVVIASSSIKQITDSRFEPGVQQLAGRASGAVDPSLISVQQAEPMSRFTTNDIGGVITAISITAGVCVSSGTFKQPFRKYAHCGTFAGTSAHYVLTAAEALTIIESIQASENQEATANVKTMFRSTDGLTSPVTENVSQTLDAQAFNALWKLGPVSINGTALTDVTGVSVNTGIVLKAYRDGGAIYPTLIYIESRDPYIDITFKDHDALAGHGPIFGSANAAVVGFRKMADGGTYIANNVSGHCTITSTGALKAVQTIGSTSKDTTDTLRLWCKGLSASAAATLA